MFQDFFVTRKGGLLALPWYFYLCHLSYSTQKLKERLSINFGGLSSSGFVSNTKLSFNPERSISSYNLISALRL